MWPRRQRQGRHQGTMRQIVFEAQNGLSEKLISRRKNRRGRPTRQRFVRDEEGRAGVGGDEGCKGLSQLSGIRRQPPWRFGPVGELISQGCEREPGRAGETMGIGQREGGWIAYGGQLAQ